MDKNGNVDYDEEDDCYDDEDDELNDIPEFHGAYIWLGLDGIVHSSLCPRIRSIDDLEDMVSRFGGKLYLVGGAVRDMVAGVEPHDLDYVVIGNEEALDCIKAILLRIERASIGREFPVIRFWAGRKIEVSFDTLSIVENLRGRDTTMNALAQDVSTGEIIDPFGGIGDIEAGIARYVCRKSFNPLAAFRLARQCLQMERKTGRQFRPDEGTIRVMNACRPMLAPSHRIGYEMRDAEYMRKLHEFFLILASAGITVIRKDNGELTARVSNIPFDSEEEWESFPTSAPMWA